MSHSGKSHGPVYVKVWIGLLILTVTTIVTSYYNFGAFNILIAMAIATVKASLVVLFFMHLYDDTRLNQVVFVSSLLCLGLFVALTASDLWYRRDAIPASAVSEFGAGIDLPADIAQYRAASPELLAEGQKIYTAQCATCHGAAGHGDGAANTPPPRNFTQTDGWHFGRTPLAMFKTVTAGSPGTSMAAYQSVLSVRERWAVIHFIRSNFMPTPPDDSAEEIAKATSGEGMDAPKMRIPVDMALEKMTIASPQAPSLELGSVQRSTPGATLYADHCVHCHGPSGAGGQKVAKLGVAPYAYEYVPSLSTNSTGWQENQTAFVHIVSRGLPGQAKPGFSHFTAAEWDALYSFTKSLRP